MSDDGKPNEPERDWRDMRREERDARRAARGNWHGGPWIGGALLIALGIAFLLQNFGYPLPQNWWALFLLVPGLGALFSAWSTYQASGGTLTSGVRGALVGGIILTWLAVLFFFDVHIGKYWPLILIVIGVSVLAGGVRRR